MPLLRNRLPFFLTVGFLVAAGMSLGRPTVLHAETFAAATAVNLRQGPSDNTAVIRVLEAGEKVEKIGMQGGYLQVKAKKDGAVGYVWAQTLTPVPDELETPVPGFDELKATAAKEQTTPRGGPGQFFFESVMEYVQGESHPLFVILLPLVVAVALAAAGIVLLRAVVPHLDRLLPATLNRGPRNALKIALLCALSYLFATAVLYFYDLALYFSTVARYTALAMIFLVPRLILAAPVALVDLLVKNWVVGLALLLFMIFISRTNRKTEIAETRTQPPAPAGEKTPSRVNSPSFEQKPVDSSVREFGESPPQPETKVIAPLPTPFPPMPEKGPEK